MTLFLAGSFSGSPAMLAPPLPPAAIAVAGGGAPPALPPGLGGAMTLSAIPTHLPGPPAASVGEGSPKRPREAEPTVYSSGDFRGDAAQGNRGGDGRGKGRGRGRRRRG